MNNIEGRNGFGATSALARALRSWLPRGAVFLCAVSAAGCLSPGAGAEEEPIDTAEQAIVGDNALTNNALTNNALTNNALTNNALTNNALTNNALNNISALNNALTDPDARSVLKYIVSCALPPSAQVSFTAGGTAYTLGGELGLAPQWALTGGTCTAACQELVSSCVMARVDYLGKKVLISMRGDATPLRTNAVERITYPCAEGTYFGNIFKATPERYACVAPGHVGLPRVCGPTTAGCVVEDLGSCDHVCSRFRFDGSFTRCSNQNSDHAEDDDFERDTFDNAVTIFLGL